MRRRLLLSPQLGPLQSCVFENARTIFSGISKGKLEFVNEVGPEIGFLGQ